MHLSRRAFVAASIVAGSGAVVGRVLRPESPSPPSQLLLVQGKSSASRTFTRAAASVADEASIPRMEIALWDIPRITRNVTVAGLLLESEFALAAELLRDAGLGLALQGRHRALRASGPTTHALSATSSFRSRTDPMHGSVIATTTLVGDAWPAALGRTLAHALTSHGGRFDTQPQSSDHPERVLGHFVSFIAIA